MMKAKFKAKPKKRDEKRTMFFINPVTDEIIGSTSITYDEFAADGYDGTYRDFLYINAIIIETWADGKTIETIYTD